MLKCREVVDEADQFLSDDLPRHRQWRFRFHLLICKHCSRYVHQFQALKDATSFMHRKASDEEISRIMDSIDD
ncbi:MAG: zf-HC2 domain-containing protein [Pseudomonadales bacterium]|nr:zf-HC2 domain-containing protein [Pseudomonadales bacterium]